jgi:UDP-N-acetylglucosamine 3-dehydrogenase
MMTTVCGPWREWQEFGRGCVNMIRVENVNLGQESSPLTVAVVGAGGMGSTQARSFARIPGVVLAAVADIDSAKAAALAQRHGAVAHATVDGLLESGVPDIAVVAIPTDSHVDVALQLLEAGCHVLIEKPLALTLADADRLLGAVPAGRTVAVGQCVRFFPEYAQAKALVESRAVGAPAAIRCRRGGGFPGWSPWFADPGRSGGVLFDLGVHEFDWLLWCFGPVERVYARSLTGRLNSADPRDYALATLRHRNGAISHVECCWADPATGYTAYEIAGDAGLLTHDSRKACTLTRSSRTGKSSLAPLIADDDPYHRQAVAFVDTVRGKSTAIASVADGRAAVAVAAAAVESARTGKAVTL